MCVARFASETMRTLFIGEDCDQHVTCMGWAYNVDTKVLRRTLTAPMGSELTGSAFLLLPNRLLPT